MIKKHRNKNDYFYSGNSLWVRNFAKKVFYSQDINSLIKPSEMSLFLENESKNKENGWVGIDSENYTHDKIVIVNGGWNYTEKLMNLCALPPDVTFIGINEAASKWNINRRLNYYLINNPYEDCLELLPSKTIKPKMIASVRTNPIFLEKYDGQKYLYDPVKDANYAGMSWDFKYQLDDYRNPMCAAISLAHQFNAKKILICFPDEGYEQERPAAIKIKEDFWMFQQQINNYRLTEGMLFWLKEAKIDTAIYGNVLEYKHTTYIDAGGFARFFS
jgi:hypothetical protein